MTEHTDFDSPALRLNPETQSATMTSPIRTTKVQNLRLQNKKKKAGKQLAREEKQDTTRTGKQSEEQVRKARLEEHSLLLHVTPTRLPTSTDEAYDQLLSTWRKIERYGFQVSRDPPGCWIPYKQYLQNSGGREEMAPHVAAMLFNGMAKPEAAATTDSDGWPVSLQYSHLCHLAMCCNPSHIVLEPQWMNQRRNYCGKQGRCDCNMSPPCLAKYYPSNVERNLSLLSYRSSRLGERVRATCSMAIADIKIESSTKYAVQDMHRNNRRKRKMRSNKHEAQRLKNEERKTKQKVSSD